MNSSVFFNNLTQRSISTNRTAEIVRTIFETLIIIFFCLFLYFIWLLLYVFFTTPHVRDNARYVLFIHMLINDTIYLSTGLILLFTSIFVVYLPVPICYVIVTLASATFKITPYNLAAMALERYVAICFPLRHLTLCTSQRSNYVIAIIWTIGLIPNIADFIILSTSTEKTIFSLNLICTRETLTINIVQNTLRSNTLIISLILVGLIIVFTYVRVIFIAKNMNSGSRSASKAGKTVMLHAFQFLLSLMSLTSTFVETQLRNYISFLPVVNFFVFTCLPRCLSPLIYGVRDHVFSKRIGQMYSAKP